MSENVLNNPENQEDAPRPFPAMMWIVLIVILLGFIIGFDWIKEWGGRTYYEIKIPEQLSELNIVGALGEPDRKCDGSPECMKFLDSFVFKKGRPAQISSYLAYSEHYPLLPLLVFYKDQQGSILGYDYGLN